MNSLKNFLFNNWNSIFSKTRNDFVFDKKNKNYGAYFLRKGYFKTLIRSYLIAILFLLLLVYTPSILEIINELRNKNILTDKEISELSKSTDIVLQPPPEIQLDITKPPAIPQIIIQRKDTIPPKPKENSSPKDTVIINQDSLLLAMKDSLEKDSLNRIKDSSALANDIINTNGSLRMKVDAMPEFPGGAIALRFFLKTHIQYSLRAKASNTMGIVNVSFVVEADGSLTNIRLLMAVGNGLDDAVIQMIQAMPHWKPGMRRGKPQRFLVNLPVNFTLKDK